MKFSITRQVLNAPHFFLCTRLKFQILFSYSSSLKKTLVASRTNLQDHRTPPPHNHPTPLPHPNTTTASTQRHLHIAPDLPMCQHPTTHHLHMHHCDQQTSMSHQTHHCVNHPYMVSN